MALQKVGLRKVKRKKGYVYQIDYSINGKRTREVVGSNKTQAERYRDKLQTDLMMGKLGISNEHTKISLEQVYKDYISLKQNLSDSSKKRYRVYYEEFNHFLSKYFPATEKDISLIRTNYIRESIDHLLSIGTSRGNIWQPKTTNGYKLFLASLFKFALKKNYVTDNPASEIPDKRIERKVKHEYFTKEQVGEILKNINPHWVDYFEFLINTGLRKGEINNLKWKNYNTKDRKIIIASDEDWTTKTNEARMVPLNDIALKIIENQKDKNAKYIFTQMNGEKIHPDRSYSALKKTLKKLNLEGDVHKFRHTFASNFMMSGAGSLYDLATILGHKNLATSQIYAHLADKHLLDTLQKMSKE